ncbi:MAG: AraC family transcriptional regulator [Eubacterium sp.]|nr:AraC family transcriptional regulator [Eubacterium sp.]
MQFFELHEKKEFGTPDFPFEFFHVGPSHSRYVMNYHWHPEFELIRVLKGRLIVTLDEREFTLSEGELAFVHGGELHSGRPENDCVYECLDFNLNAFLRHNPACSAYIQKIIDRSAMIFSYFSAEYHDIHHIIEHIFSAIRDRKEGYELTVYGELYHFFGICFEEHYYQQARPENRRGYRKVMQLKTIIGFIDENYASPITLDDMASTVNMSPKYFCRFFQQMTHHTPIDYLNLQRIEHACYRLSTTEESVTDIAFSCGFNDPSYFIKLFKRYKGITPGQYSA